jgi:hypothetical protein
MVPSPGAPGRPGIPDERPGTARLTISDWADERNPGGPIGQEMVYNFVEVQPYFE